MRFVSAARISVRVQASARKSELVGVRDGVLIVRVTAPAIEGRANESLRRLIAKRLGLSKSAVTIARGQRSRNKVIEIDGLEQPAVLDLLTR
jgi:uncharacterized protein